MYLNVMVTVVAGLLLFWILHDVVFSRFLYKPFKALAKHTGKSQEYFDQTGQMRAAFDKGDFEQVLNICEEILKERPFESAALSYKAYSLYHLKRIAEAKAVFEQLETLPDGKDCSRMIEKIEKMKA